MGDCISWCNPVFKRVLELPPVMYATRNHAYIMPDNNVYILNEMADGYIPLTQTTNDNNTQDEGSDTNVSMKLLPIPVGLNAPTYTFDARSLYIRNKDGSHVITDLEFKYSITLMGYNFEGYMLYSDFIASHSEVDSVYSIPLIPTPPIGDMEQALSSQVAENRLYALVRISFRNEYLTIYPTTYSTHLGEVIVPDGQSMAVAYLKHYPSSGGLYLPFVEQ